jgi:2-methylcitrate dehydratase PrpD
VRARVDPEIEARYPSAWPAKVAVRLENGETFEAETTHPKGDPEAPLTRAEIESKFLSLAAFGRREAEAALWLDWVRGMRTAERVRLPRGKTQRR